MAKAKTGSQAKIRLTGKTKVVHLGCLARPQVKDVIVFVAGTTDPVNVKELKAEANASYWEDNVFLTTYMNEFKKTYCDAHINDKITWSGDNSIEIRKKTGEKIKNYLLRYYAGWKKRKVAFHFITHSHGGLVTNEFSQFAAKDADFPKTWKVKSITYLSTPFFTDEHKPELSVFHPDYRIIVVNNQYDLTQRFIANFSMHQIPYLQLAFSKNKVIKAHLDNINRISTAHADDLALLQDLNLSNSEGHRAYPPLRDILNEIMAILIEFQRIFENARNNSNALSQQSFSDINQAIGSIMAGFRDLRNHIEQRIRADNDYDRRKWDIARLLNALEDLFNFNSTTLSMGILEILDKILIDKIDQFSDTVLIPPYYPRSNVKIIDVSHHDPYHVNTDKNKIGPKDKEFNNFISDLESIEKSFINQGTPRQRHEIILRLLAQLRFNYSKSKKLINASTADFINDNITSILDTLQFLFTGQIDARLKTLESSFNKLSEQLRQWERNIVLEEDQNPRVAIESERGSIVHLAYISHSISRQKLYPEVKSELDQAMESEHNPSYKGPNKMEITIDIIGKLIKNAAKKNTAQNP